MGLGSDLDRLILPFAPGLAQKRATARLMFDARVAQAKALSTYAAAERNRTTSDWPSKCGSADEAIIPDSPVMNARSRAAVRDDWGGNSAVGGYRRHIVGTGITCRANARNAKGEPLKEFNKAADKLWYRWGNRPKWCDIEKRKSLLELQSLAVTEFITVGQALAVMTYKQQPDRVGLQVQMFESEMLDTTKRSNDKTSNEVRNGIELDANGAAVAYWVYVRGELNGLRAKSVRIPAERVLHLMRQERPRQSHGVTRLASVLKKLLHLGMYEEYTMIRARFEACIGMALEDTDVFAVGGGISGLGLKGDSNDDGVDARGNTEARIEPGMLLKLPKGQKPHIFDPKSPGNNYSAYVDKQAAHVGAGCGLDFATITRDYSQGNYSSQRQGLIETNLEIDPLQFLVVDLFLRPLRDEFITLAILEGRLEAPEFLSDPEIMLEYLEADWQGPPKPWIDPLKEVKAECSAIDYRIKTRREVANRNGKDWREDIQQHHDEQAFADELGVSLPDNQTNNAGEIPPQNNKE